METKTQTQGVILKVEMKSQWNKYKAPAQMAGAVVYI